MSLLVLKITPRTIALLFGVFLTTFYTAGTFKASWHVDHEAEIIPIAHDLCAHTTCDVVAHNKCRLLDFSGHDYDRLSSQYRFGKFFNLRLTTILREGNFFPLNEARAYLSHRDDSLPHLSGLNFPLTTIVMIV
jgi:hypothetical protein